MVPPSLFQSVSFSLVPSDNENDPSDQMERREKEINKSEMSEQDRAALSVSDVIRKCVLLNSEVILIIFPQVI